MNPLEFDALMKESGAEVSMAVTVEDPMIAAKQELRETMDVAMRNMNRAQRRKFKRNVRRVLSHQLKTKVKL